MKFLLSMLICSGIYGTCLPPLSMPEPYDSYYDCMAGGYNEGLRIVEEVGKEEVNRSKTYVKFYCVPLKEVDKGKPT